MRLEPADVLEMVEGLERVGELPEPLRTRPVEMAIDLVEPPDPQVGFGGAVYLSFVDPAQEAALESLKLEERVRELMERRAARAMP